MRGYHLLPVLFISFITQLLGQHSHLLIYSQGEGALVRSGESSNPLKKASFLPADSRISVRPRSGIETLAAGFQFRFGAGTVFSLDRDKVNLEQGAVLVNSRRISNNLSITGPESSMGVRGVGCSLLNVEPNGGFKAVGLLGKTVLSDQVNGKEFTLLPGQLVFLMPGGRGFGQEVSVNLAKLIESSYLVSGFPNSSSFSESLTGMTDAQSQMVGKTYGAVVGSAKQAESFEVVPTGDQPAPVVPDSPSPSAPSSVSGFDGDPLSELLGRPPTRLPVESNASPSPRPFPSRLLRGIE